jgi:hypothetical protein
LGPTELKGKAVRIEPSGDPVWNERGRRLLEFLAKPRSWSELRQWANNSTVGVERMRHTLAHIDPLFRIVKGSDKVRRWVRLGVVAEHEAANRKHQDNAGPEADLVERAV